MNIGSSNKIIAIPYHHIKCPYCKRTAIQLGEDNQFRVLPLKSINHFLAGRSILTPWEKLDEKGEKDIQCGFCYLMFKLVRHS